ncbi:hypothetical protein D3C78_780120 [compost metagenome]
MIKGNQCAFGVGAAPHVLIDHSVALVGPAHKVCFFTVSVIARSYENGWQLRSGLNAFGQVYIRRQLNPVPHRDQKGPCIIDTVIRLGQQRIVIYSKRCQGLIAFFDYQLDSVSIRC